MLAFSYLFTQLVRGRTSDSQPDRSQMDAALTKRLCVMLRCLVAAAADLNLLKVPDGMEDSKVVLLSDIMPTGWHGATLANVQKGDRVAIWGCGPGVQIRPNNFNCARP